jgi:catechol 2,3-dioxygenase-like lactoylglutathione lyase family enzyme
VKIRHVEASLHRVPVVVPLLTESRSWPVWQLLGGLSAWTQVAQYPARMPDSTGASILATSPLISFVATAHPSQAQTFFEGVLGLRLVSDDPFALVFDANGATLRVAKVDSLSPQPFTVLGWLVADIAATIRQLGERGVRFERYTAMGMVQDDLGIWTAPGGAQIAWFKDPDGNTLSLTQL